MLMIVFKYLAQKLIEAKKVSKLGFNNIWQEGRRHG